MRAGGPAFDDMTDGGGHDRDAMLAGRGNGVTEVHKQAFALAPTTIAAFKCCFSFGATARIIALAPEPVSGPRDVDPRNFPMPRFHTVRKSQRRYGYNLKRARHRIKDKLFIGKPS